MDLPDLRVWCFADFGVGLPQLPESVFLFAEFFIQNTPEPFSPPFIAFRKFFI